MSNKNKGKGTQADSKEDPNNNSSNLPVEIKSILEQVPKEKRNLVLRQLLSVTIRESHSGPLPAPSTLEKYNNIIEKGAERIMVMAEKQSGHRIELEKTAITKQLKQSGIGQVFALIIAILALIISWDLASNGHDTVAGIIGGTTVIGLVSAFIYGKQSQRKDLNEKER